MKKVSDCDKIFVRTLVPQYSVTLFTISVLSNKFSPLIPLAFGRLPYTDDRNYRPHLQLIYLWWSPDDRGPFCPIHSRPYLLITDQCKCPSKARKCQAVLCWIVGVEVQSHSFIGFCRVRMTRWLFFIVIDGVINDESLTVSLYPSGCEEDEVHIEGKVYACTAVPIQINRICKRFLPPTVNTTGVTRKTTMSIKTKSLTIFVPGAFYLISWCCCSKQKSSGKLQTSHHAKTSPYTTTMTQLTLSLVTYRFLQTCRR